MANTYKDLDIFKLAFDLYIRCHKFTMKLPKHELYELGSQLRRSSDSVVTNIAEGYGRKRYKQDFIRFLIFSHSSNDETIVHLLKLQILYPGLIEEAKDLQNNYELLGGKINNFITYVETKWNNNN
jgi:four helix bundle protein